MDNVIESLKKYHQTTHHYPSHTPRLENISKQINEEIPTYEPNTQTIDDEEQLQATNPEKSHDSQTKMKFPKDGEQLIQVPNVATVSHTITKLQKYTDQSLQAPYLEKSHDSQTKMKFPKDGEQLIQVPNVATVSHTIAKLQKYSDQSLQVPNLEKPQNSQTKMNFPKDGKQSIPVPNLEKSHDSQTKMNFPKDGKQSIPVPYLEKPQKSQTKMNFPKDGKQSIPVPYLEKSHDSQTKMNFPKDGEQSIQVPYLEKPHDSQTKMKFPKDGEQSIPVPNLEKPHDSQTKMNFPKDGEQSIPVPYLEKSHDSQTKMNFPKDGKQSIPVPNLEKSHDSQTKMNFPKDGEQSIQVPYLEKPHDSQTKMKFPKDGEQSIPVPNLEKPHDSQTKMNFPKDGEQSIPVPYLEKSHDSQTKMNFPKDGEQSIPVPNLEKPHDSQTKMNFPKDGEQSIQVPNLEKPHDSQTKMNFPKDGEQSIQVPYLEKPHDSQTKMKFPKDGKQSIPVPYLEKPQKSQTKMNFPKDGKQSIQVPYLEKPQNSETKMNFPKDGEQSIQVPNLTTVSHTIKKFPEEGGQSPHKQKIPLPKHQISKKEIQSKKKFPQSMENPKQKIYEKALFQIHSKIELPSRGSLQGKLNDSEMISHMVLSAKENQWERVWEVLDNKPHLVNCIPSERAWSVLHQAVWHNNVQAVVKILSYPACDTEIRTKQDRKCKSGPGMKPIDLAKSQQMKDILQSHQGTYMKSDEAPTMLPVDKMLYALGSCIHMTLSCNQGVLIPPKWPIEDHNTVHSIPYIMQAIFSHIDVADNWIKTKTKVSLTLQQYSKALGEKLWGESELTEDTKHQFFGRIIRLYTEDLRKICSVVNQMLRLQDTSISEYQPTTLELSLCPYALLLNSILLHWNELKGYTGITYRSCCLTKEQASEYVKGQQFVWLGFSSSSKQQGAFIAANYSHKASTYDFIIDNGKYNHKWAPRGIARYSAFAKESECLYPFGARFQVTEVICNKVYIRLIDY